MDMTMQSHSEPQDAPLLNIGDIVTMLDQLPLVRALVIPGILMEELSRQIDAGDVPSEFAHLPVYGDKFLPPSVWIEDYGTSSVVHVGEESHALDFGWLNPYLRLNPVDKLN